MMTYNRRLFRAATVEDTSRVFGTEQKAPQLVGWVRIRGCCNLLDQPQNLNCIYGFFRVFSAPQVLTMATRHALRLRTSGIACVVWSVTLVLSSTVILRARGRSKMIGNGPTARVGVFDGTGRSVGKRFVVSTAPSTALQTCVTQLVNQGFISRQDDLPNRLRAAGSPWTAWAVEIGDAKKSWRSGFIADIIEETPLGLLPRFQRIIAPTLVMIAARPSPDLLASLTAGSEVVIYPHLSRKGDPQAAMGATTRIREAFQAITSEFQQAGQLITQEKIVGIRNDGCPASQQGVRELLDWK